MNRARPREQDVAAIVVAWLEALGADVYQEVECAGGVADIVARVRAELWIVEVKTSPTLALLYQALQRRVDAHRVFVATPSTRTLREFGALARELGVGVLEVHAADVVGEHRYDPRIRELCPSRRWNTRPVRLASRLKPEHKTHAKAGAVGGGGRWTPFRDTCEQILREVAANPGTTIRAVVNAIRHHYATPASARSSLTKWISDGAIKGVVQRAGRLWPEAMAAEMWPADEVRRS